MIHNYKNEIETLLDLCSDILCLLSHDGSFDKASSAFFEILGYKKSDLTTLSFFELLPSEDREDVINEFHKLKNNDKKVYLNGHYRQSNSSFISLSWTISKIPNSELLCAVASPNVVENKLLQLQHILNAETIIAKTDKAGKIIEVNDKFCEISGYSRDELLGKTHQIINSGMHSKEFFKKLWATISSGKIWTGLIRNQRKNGGFYYVQSIISATFSSDGNIDGYIAIRFDATQQIELRQDYKKTLHILNETSSIAKVGGWELNLKTNHLSWTDETYKIFEINKSIDEKLNLSEGIELFVPRSKKIIELAIQETINNGTPYSLELEALTAKGKKIWVYTNGKANYRNGKIVSISGTVQDINERKKDQNTLIKNKKRYENIVEGSDDLITIITPDGFFKFVNHVSNTVFGLPPKDCLNLSAYDFVHPEDKEKTVTAIYQCIHNGKPIQNFENRQISVDGNICYISWNMRLSFDENGDIEFCTSVGRDVTARKKMEAQLHLALHHAEQSNKAKSEFLASMSHELRTPLNAIIGFSDLLHNQYFGPLGSPKYIEYAADIYNSGELLLELVSDILDLSSIEAGEKTLKKDPILISQIIEESVHIVSTKALEKKITINSNVAKNLPPIALDKRAIKQVLLNLLSNSVKFTDHSGAVEIEAFMLDAEIKILIMDNGCGIPQSKISEITSPFIRSDHDPHLSEKGWGLGLAISKSLVELHNGELAIESELNIGTKVTISLPAY